MPQRSRPPVSVMAAQRLLINRLTASEPGGVDKGRIAEAAGVGGSMVSKWITEGEDPREMTADEMRRLADAFGYDVVYGAPAKARGYIIARRPAALADGQEPIVLAADASGCIGLLIQEIVASMSPTSEGGAESTPGELARAMRRLEDAESAMARLRAQLEEKLRGLK